jgi:hypothetical protein
MTTNFFSMTKSVFPIQIASAGLVLLFASACIDVEVAEGDAGDGDTSTGDDAPGDGDGDGDNGDGDGDRSEQGGDGDGDENGDGDGDGDPDPAIVEACTGACDLIDSCEGGVSIPDCVDGCVQQHIDYEDPACTAAELALTECVADLTCEQFEQLIEEAPEPFPCQTELEATCGGQLCTVDVGLGENPGECEVSVSCEGQPEESVSCDGITCTCYVDNVEVGSCDDAIGVCGDPGPNAMDACCG